MKFEISKVADTLVSQSTIVKCSLEEAWEEWMHPILTEQFSFEEVKRYISEQILLGRNYPNF